MSLLAYVHPVWMSITVLLCLTTGYSGLLRFLQLRKSRIKLPGTFDFKMHPRSGTAFNIMLVIGYLLGIAGVVSLGANPLTTPHSYLGTLIVVIYGSAAYFGVQLKKGKIQYRSAHAVLNAVGTLLLLFQVLGGIAMLQNFGLF